MYVFKYVILLISFVYTMAHFYLYPLMVEFISIHFIIAEIIYFLVFKKVKYIFIPNIVAFGFYIFQVVVFYILLSF